MSIVRIPFYGLFLVFDTDDVAIISTSNDVIHHDHKRSSLSTAHLRFAFFEGKRPMWEDAEGFATDVKAVDTTDPHR